MRTIYCFDLDNTVLSRKTGLIPTQTIRLLTTIKANKDNILVLATGRRSSETELISEISQYFDYFIFLNGALIIHDGKIIFKRPINQIDLLSMLKKAAKFNFSFGLTGLNDEYIFNIKDETKLKWRLPLGYQTINKPFVSFKKEIYQVWLLNDNKKVIADFIKEFSNFRTFYWHQGGAHFVYNDINKANALMIIKERYPKTKIIAIGDGHNDIELLDMADIGIAMGNATHVELRKKASLIAPDIDEDKLYDFYSKNELI